jgi:hypothetical protein
MHTNKPCITEIGKRQRGGVRDNVQEATMMSAPEAMTTGGAYKGGERLWQCLSPTEI